jgi:internalin A
MVANEAEGQAEALRRIAACRATQAEELDLGGLQLTVLDGKLLVALCQLGWLRRLFLGPSAEAREKPELASIDRERNSAMYNALSALPDALFTLTRLERIDLAFNRLRGVPASLANLPALTSLDLSDNNLGADGAQLLKRLAALTSLDLSNNSIGNEGAGALEGLVNLTKLDLSGNSIEAEGAQALKGLIKLTALNLNGNYIGPEGAKELKNLVGLTSLDLSSNEIGAVGTQALKKLLNLNSLNLSWNEIGVEGMQPLKDLVNLTALDLCNNNIGPKGAQVLKSLINLTSLKLDSNSIGPNGMQALKGLVNLTNLELYNNRVGDNGMQALKGLVNLTTLDLTKNNIGAKGAQALEGLFSLTSLTLASNNIGGKGAQALKGLVNLTELNLYKNHIGAKGAQALKGLINLTTLHLGHNDIGAEGARALKGLVNLTSVELPGNRIRDISPLVSLRNLRTINLSGNHVDHDAPAFWMLPSLQQVILHDASLPGVPVEILSTHSGDNCLDRLRAHLADLSGDDVAVGDVKLMILGNGRVGKTQICRRLRGEGFDEAVPSTHGIQVSSVPLESDAPVTLKIWDFGGQDIYHGTHALFLKSRAIFPLVWTPRSEEEQFHTHGGFTFRNQPLAYWLAYVGTFGGAQSPVFVVQSQCDRPEDERDPPLPSGALDGFDYKKVLHYSAKGDGTHARGHAALEEALLDAVQWMRGNRGVAKIGPGRAAVKEALEAKLAAGQRLISYRSYLDLCAEAERTEKGRVSDPALLLDYLHNTGAVFYRKGLFGDQIILDQGWALDAVYTVFDRASQSFKKIERNHGRFRRSELAEWVGRSMACRSRSCF